MFRKVLQCKAAYARSCTSVHNVSKEIICLGRCCFTWKHLPAARFHQRADLWIDFPSMTCSICRALKSSFISSAVAQDWSNKTKQLRKRHSAPKLPQKHRKCQDGVVAEAEPWCRGKGVPQEMLWAQTMGVVMSRAGNCISQSVFLWKPTSSSGDKALCQHSSPERGTRSAAAASTESWHVPLPFLSLHSGSPHARTCLNAFLFYLQWCQRQPFDDLWPTEG